MSMANMSAAALPTVSARTAAMPLAWRSRNPSACAPARCSACGGTGERSGTRLLPIRQALPEAPLSRPRTTLEVRAAGARLEPAASRAHLALLARAVLPQLVPVLPLHQGALRRGADRALHARRARGSRPLGR